MYKFLELKENKIVSGYNNDFIWEVGKWYTTKGKLAICANGFHCSEKPLDALYYVGGDVLAEVEVSGKSIIENDKQCWQKMKLIKAYKWTKKDSLKLAIYSAELVLNIYEKKYPGDDRPRKAIDAAKKVLKNDNEKNRAAAWAAAEAAEAASWAAAGAAAEAAEAAAWAAGAAARAAARAAAEAAAWADINDTLDKINTWFINHIKELKSISRL